MAIVAAIGGESCLVKCDNGCPRGPREARYEGATAIAVRDVLGGMAILGWYDYRAMSKERPAGYVHIHARDHAPTIYVDLALLHQ